MKETTLNLSDVSHLRETWKKDVFDEFYAAMTNEDIKFPCIFGSAGVKSS